MQGNTHQTWRQHYGRKEFEIRWFLRFYFSIWTSIYHVSCL